MNFFESFACMHSDDKDVKRPLEVFVRDRTQAESPNQFNLEEALKLKNEATELFEKFKKSKNEQKNIDLMSVAEKYVKAADICPREEKK